MMDSRSIITQKICMTLVKHGVTQGTIDEVRMQLEVELAKYEVYERCTEIIPVEKTPYQYLQMYLNVKKIEGKSDATIERYRYELGKLLEDVVKPLDEITTNDLRVYLEYRRTHVNKKPLSNRTIDNMRNVYSPFFAWLTAERIVSYNPCLALHKVKYKKTVRTVFSSVDMQKLREACETIRDIAMIDWLASTGCRINEVATTQISLIDWENRSCTVTGKGNKERKVYFDSVTAMHIKQYLNTRKDSVDALFVTSTGKPLTKDGIHQAIKRTGLRADVSKTHCHRFRHTLASELVSNMPVTEVADILGHDSISTTQVYCHTDNTKVMSDYRRIRA